MGRTSILKPLINYLPTTYLLNKRKSVFFNVRLTFHNTISLLST